MAKIIFFCFILVLLFLGFVSALDCQYLINHPFKEEVLGFYEDDALLTYLALESKEFADGGKNGWFGTCTYPNFKTYNNYDKEINVTISYVFKGQRFTQESIIASKGYVLVQNNACGESGLDNSSSVLYDIHMPTDLKWETRLMEFDNISCKICLSGKQCLDDGALCTPNNPSNDCGSAICNIAGVCGVKGSPFIVPCLNGKLNCNNQNCLTPSIKKGGEAYFCDWECESGKGQNGVCNVLCTNTTLTCDNRTCVTPSSKKAGEKYTCIQECITQKGKDGICTHTFVTWLKANLWWIITLLVIFIIIVIIKNKKIIDWIISDAKKTAEEIIKQAEKTGDGIVSKAMEEQEKILVSTKSKREGIENKINDLENKIKEKESMGIDLVEISKLREKLTKQKEELSDEKNIMEKAVKDWQKAEIEYIKPFKIKGRGGEAWRNPNILNKYYPCYWHGEGMNNHTEIHKDIAKKEIFNYYNNWFKEHFPNESFEDFIVHHIDKNPDNFELKNLALVLKTKHDGIHSDIQKDNWDSGIVALKARGIKQPHIKELNY